MRHDHNGVRTAAMLFIGAVGVIAIGVQSAMYGALERAGRIGVGEIGLAASLEMITLACGVLIAGRLARGLNLVVIGGLGAIGLTAANLAMPGLAGNALIGLRAVAGLFGGILLWLANAYIVVSPRAVRLAALFLILQTVTQFSVAAGAAAFAPGNADAIPLMMAACGAVALALAPAARGWTALPEEREAAPAGRFDARAIMALGIMILLQFSLVGGWILVELVGAAAGLPADTIAAATPVMLAAQVAGGLIAVTTAERLSWANALAGAGLLLAAVQATMGLASAPLPFIAAAIGYGVVWNFALPQLTAMSLAADPTLRIARIGPASVVTGAALGPLASATIADASSPAIATLAFIVPSLALIGAALALHNAIAARQHRA